MESEAGAADTGAGSAMVVVAGVGSTAAVAAAIALLWTSAILKGDTMICDTRVERLSLCEMRGPAGFAGEDK